MGEKSILTSEQKKVLSFVNRSNYLKERYYLTGGTALSEYYLKHRFSEDLDFFTEQPLEPENVFEIISELSKLLDATVDPHLIDNRMYISEFTLPDKSKLKIDFCYYPHPRLKPKKVADELAIDSLFDIAVNKLTTIGQRSTVKDFVDLYYLIPEFGFWDLTYGAEKKFRVKYEPFLLSSDMMVVKTFTTLPRMIKPLTLKQLQDFFIDKAKELAKKSVTK